VSSCSKKIAHIVRSNAESHKYTFAGLEYKVFSLQKMTVAQSFI